MYQTNWKTEIEKVFEDTADTWEDVIATTLTEEQLVATFNDNYGQVNGCPFTLWTHNYTYVPCCYDGAEWVVAIPRNPCNKPTPHIGG